VKKIFIPREQSIGPLEKPWYEDLPDETLNDVMWEIMEEKEQDDLISAEELRRRIKRLRWEAQLSGDSCFKNRQMAYDMVLMIVDHMQGR
jgi:hypothetical protein